MLFVNVTDKTIINVKGIDYCCIIHDISQSDKIHFLGNFVFDDCQYISIAFQRKQY